MKAKEFQSQSVEQLQGELVRLRKDLQVQQVKARTNQLKNVRNVRKLHKDIARVLTVMTMKQTSQQ